MAKKQFACSCLLLKSEERGWTCSITLHHIEAGSEERAVEIAKERALELKPGFSISQVLTLDVSINLGENNDE